MIQTDRDVLAQSKRFKRLGFWVRGRATKFLTNRQVGEILSLCSGIVTFLAVLGFLGTLGFFFSSSPSLKDAFTCTPTVRVIQSPKVLTPNEAKYNRFLLLTPSHTPPKPPYIQFADNSTGCEAHSKIFEPGCQILSSPSDTKYALRKSLLELEKQNGEEKLMPNFGQKVTSKFEFRVKRIEKEEEGTDFDEFAGLVEAFEGLWELGFPVALEFFLVVGRDVLLDSLQRAAGSLLECHNGLLYVPLVLAPLCCHLVA